MAEQSAAPVSAGRSCCSLSRGWRMANQQALHSFAQWVSSCSGNEKQEGQTFVQKLFSAWGWEDATEAGVSFEHKIPKGGAGGGVGFADALIPGKVLIEMKPRGEGLRQHFPQLQRYWFNLAPKPSYAILCNFDQFWIYDFNQQVDEPVELLHTADLMDRWPALAFLSKQPQKPLFGNNQVTVTEKQAQAMGHLFHELKQQAAKTANFTDQQAQRFVLQCVLCMFAEDRELLPDRLFSLALESCREKNESTFDVLSGLFHAMNTPGKTEAGRFKGTPYFNGGLFSEIPRIELSPAQLGQLIDSARENWRMIRPSIFGNIFEASSDDAKRHALGQHFTSEPDILKVVRPTIIEPWEARIEAAKSIPELEQLLIELQAFRVLDPACGSGNFLYMGYNGLKDIEATILSKIQVRRRSEALKGQGVFGFVTTNQFFGIDTDPFAVELARVTLMIARKVAHDRLGLTEQELPLDNLDKNIVQADALFTPWPDADAIVGNPPFLGGKRIRGEMGDEYAEKIYTGFDSGSNFADICCYWFRLAHDRLKPEGRAGLVGTNMIRRGYNRRASIDYIVENGGFICDAVSSQPWSGEANVHVSIVNWAKRRPVSCRLDGSQVARINSSLDSDASIVDAKRIKKNSGFCYIGVQPTGLGFEITEEEVSRWIQADQRNTEVLRPFSMGSNLAKRPLAIPDRWIIDFGIRPLEAAEKYNLPFEHVLHHVKPDRLSKRNKELHLKWWLHWRPRPAMRKALINLTHCFAVPRVSKWAVFVEMKKSWLPGEKNVVIASEDYYIFALLTSSVHRIWMHSQKGTLKGDIAYTPETCFETFPFPQRITPEQAEAIRQQMIELNEYRNSWMVEQQKGITAMYNRYFEEPASKLRKLHDALDALVIKAYGWSAKEDILSNLLDLNLELAEMEEEGRAIVGPWDPNRPPK
jgi:SAM-dependent methyltransferase